MTSRALCAPDNLPAHLTPDSFFAEYGSQEQSAAKALCLQCPLYWQCSEYAVNEGIPAGVWGGNDDRFRRRLWQENGGRPKVFDQIIDSQIGPLLQDRRNRETEEARQREEDPGLCVCGAVFSWAKSTKHRSGRRRVCYACERTRRQAKTREAVA